VDDTRVHPGDDHDSHPRSDDKRGVIADNRRMLAAAALGPGAVLLILLVVGGTGYGIVRLRARRRPPDETPWRRDAADTDRSDGRDRTSADRRRDVGMSSQGHLLGAEASSPGAPARSSRALPPLLPDGEGWAIETRGLYKRFGTNVAVDDVDLRVPRGSAFGYLGPNGAGKTTLIRTLLGLTRADSGSMWLLGIPVPKDRSRALAKVGAIVDEPRFHGHLTGRENLLLLAAARGGGANARIAPMLERVGLSKVADSKVASYSMGMRQRLGVAACLIGDPDLLMLDEPMNGLDPAGMHEMRALIRELADEGRTVLLSSHLLDEVERTCDAVAIVDRGSVIRQGPIDELVRGANVLVQVECSDPEVAARILEAAAFSTAGTPHGEGLQVKLPAGSSRDVIADVNRILVAGGIAVYGLHEERTRLEDWFLSVTNRFGGER
jgi:ABC-2 type transport system ATP-binding protein